MSDKNLKLSELIRIGSKVTGQCRRNLCIKQTNSTCAIGAAYLAKHGELPNNNMLSTDALKDCGVDDPIELVYFDTVEVQLPLVNAICRANDQLGWTREEIANRLEELGL